MMTDLRDSYSDCTVVPGDSCEVPFLFELPSVAWLASFVQPHFDVVEIVGLHNILEGLLQSWILLHHIR